MEAELASGPPPEGYPVPDVARRLAGGRPVRAVWLNAARGVTCEIDAGDQLRYVKWSPAANAPDLRDEAARMQWAGGFVAVPTVVDDGADESGSWLLTEGLPGEMAVVDRWKADPLVAVTAIGEGLRRLHDALPVDSCPFTWTDQHRIETVRARVDAGAYDRRQWHRDHQRFSHACALEILSTPPPADHTVVCHGDACAPNTLVDADGRFCGHVDIGSLGVADRWADLAVATWSTTWNFGPGWELPLLDAYGVAPDVDRMGYYRLLYDLAG